MWGGTSRAAGRAATARLGCRAVASWWGWSPRALLQGPGRCPAGKWRLGRRVLGLAALLPELAVLSA